MKKAVVLVSGGLDSATVLAIAKNANYQIHAISFDYGQKHKIELEMAKQLARSYDASHMVINLDRAVFSSSALVSKSLEVPKFASLSDVENIIPITYVPARNTLFLSYALSYAESIGAFDIFIGVHASDAAQYPDCRPQFIDRFQELANVATATEQKISIHAPLLFLTKAQIVERGIKLGVNYANTVSCYNPSQEFLACGRCLACIVRLDAFEQNNVLDPVKYQK